MSDAPLAPCRSLGEEVTAEVKALEAFGLEALRSEWRRRLGPPPRTRSSELLRLILAWRIQAEAFGGLDADLRRRLRSSQAGPAPPKLAPGTRLAREWLGQAHEVVVEESGYAYRGRHYRSLSAIARQIAGSRWNGPRFFGLRDGGAE